jgi:hypothetical protein
LGPAAAAGNRPTGPAEQALAALLATRGTLHETRSAQQSLDDAGVGLLWSALSADEMADAIVQLTRTIGQGGRDPQFARYAAFCASKGVAATPFTRAAIAAYFSSYVFVAGNKSSSLVKILSALRCYARLEMPAMWPDAAEETLIKADVVSICKTAPATLTRTVALTLEQALALVRAAKAENSPQGRQAAALLTTLTGLQARGDEVLGAGRLTFKDLSFADVGVLAGQYLGKTDKLVLRERPKAAIHFPAEYADMCASRALLEHLQADSLWEQAWADDSVKGKWSVFSVLKRCGATGRWTCSSTPLSTAAAKAILVEYLAKAGLVVPGLDIHFGRPTGTDLLEFQQLQAEPMCEALGGWAPTSTLSKFYQQHTAHKIATIAMDFMRKNHGSGFRACCDN